MIDPTDETAAAIDPPRPDPVLAALQERRARLRDDLAGTERQLGNLHAEQDRLTAVALEVRAQLDDVDAALARIEATARLAGIDAALAGLDEPDLIGHVFDDRADLRDALTARALSGAVVRSSQGSTLLALAPALVHVSAFPCTVLAVW